MVNSSKKITQTKFQRSGLSPQEFQGLGIQIIGTPLDNYKTYNLVYGCEHFRFIITQVNATQQTWVFGFLFFDF
ncbi:hypothetical protein DLH72_02810 [Candidatus Gracilibacteria bacterium]|nr:MAG: hypothetical protein DLH72_02810 [Candidatus Gracilibacteria bacterium]